MHDIQNRPDIERILGDFYAAALKEETIGHFFVEVVPLDLSSHLPRIADFWESILFNSQSYRTNVMEIHQHIHRLSSIRKEHLDTWVALFHHTVDQHFSGEKATLMKQRAASIATLMDIKLNHTNNPFHHDSTGSTA